jgi:hypothetical protein
MLGVKPRGGVCRRICVRMGAMASEQRVPGRRHVRTRVLILLGVFAALLLASAAWTIANIPLTTRETILAAPQYESALNQFPRLQGLLPRIPTQATAIQGEYLTASGMGPSSSRLEVSFSVPPAEAHELLAAARRMETLRGDELVEQEAEILIRRGDEVGSLRIQAATGRVTVELRKD